MTRSRWTEEEIATLKKEYLKADISNIASRLKRTAISVYQMAFRLGLKRGQVTNRKLRHDCDIDWLKKNYANLSNKTIAIYLGISYRRVKTLANKYGLHKSEQYRLDCSLFSKKRKREKRREYMKQRRKNNPKTQRGDKGR